MEAKRIRTLIVHRTQLVSTAMANILSNEPDIQIIGCVATAGEALDLLAESHCDLVVLNTAPMSGDALEFVRTLTQQHPSVKVIVMGLTNIPEIILQYFQAGATGYTDQSDTVAELLKKIRSASEGEAIIPPRVAAALVSRVAELARLLTTSHPYRQDRLTLQLQYKELTRREHQIPDPDRRGVEQPGDRRPADYRIGHGEEPRPQYFAQTQRREPPPCCAAQTSAL
jgi:DNA-binding NarL/FixJ family response regulator